MEDEWHKYNGNFDHQYEYFTNDVSTTDIHIGLALKSYLLRRREIHDPRCHHQLQADFAKHILERFRCINQQN